MFGCDRTVGTIAIIAAIEGYVAGLVTAIIIKKVSKRRRINKNA